MERPPKEALGHGQGFPGLGLRRRVRTGEPYGPATLVGITSRLSTTQKLGLVSPSYCLRHAYTPVRNNMVKTSPSITVAICSLGRPEALETVIRSIHDQERCWTKQGCPEIVLDTKGGGLVAARNRALAKVETPYVVFIDDDVVCPPTWLSGLLDALEKPGVVGATGPAIIPPRYQRERDLFKYRRIKQLHDRLFLSDTTHPGQLSASGCFTTTENGSTYEGEVTYLEACNMAFKTSAIRAVGGFDGAYGGIGDWSEPDVCLRIARKTGNKFWFSPYAALFHQPSRTGVYLSRRGQSRQRLSNYRLFSLRWIKPCWKHSLYKTFLSGYYTYKETEGWLHRNR